METSGAATSPFDLEIALPFDSDALDELMAPVVGQASTATPAQDAFLRHLLLAEDGPTREPEPVAVFEFSDPFEETEWLRVVAEAGDRPGPAGRMATGACPSGIAPDRASHERAALTVEEEQATGYGRYASFSPPVSAYLGLVGSLLVATLFGASGLALVAWVEPAVASHLLAQLASIV